MSPQSAPALGELPDGLLEQLVGTLEVPENRRAEARRVLRSLFTIARAEYAVDATKSKREDFSKELKRFAKKMASIRAEIDALSEPARLLLGLTEGRLGHQCFCSVIDHVLATSARFQPKARKPGRPSKQIGELGTDTSPLDHLVYLLYFFEEEMGWRISIVPERGTGTLANFLRLAEPYLPEGFIPPGLWAPTAKGVFGGWYRFQDIGAEVRRPPPADLQNEWFKKVMARINDAAACQRREVN